MLTAARLPGTGILTSDGASVNAVAYSPDGKILATGSGDGIARLWDVATHQQIGVPLGTFSHARLIESMAFSPDGRTLAVADEKRRRPAVGRGYPPAYRHTSDGRRVADLLHSLQPARRPAGRRAF